MIIWSILGWLGWSITVYYGVWSLLVKYTGPGGTIGVKASGCLLLIASIVVLFPGVSKLHLWWFFPMAYLIPIFIWQYHEERLERNRSQVNISKRQVQPSASESAHDEIAENGGENRMNGGRLNLFIRWLAVVPASLVAAFLSSFPLHWILYQTLTGSGLVQPYPEAPERILFPAAAAAAFVWAGGRTAPRRNVLVASILFFVYLGSSVAITLFVGSGVTINGVYVFSQWGVKVLAIVGAALGVWIVKIQMHGRE